MWSGNPNGTLVREVAGLEPGRALDVGAGEGGDASGWPSRAGTSPPTTSPTRPRPVARGRRRNLNIDINHADANTPEPFELDVRPRVRPLRLDPAHARQSSRPQPARRGRAGRHLLVVSHDLEPMRTPIDTNQQSRAFDPDAYVRVDDVASISESPEWRIEVHEKRRRPPGHASGSLHVDDIVLRARRTGHGQQAGVVVSSTTS
jgi:hypothetical protein